MNDISKVIEGVEKILGGSDRVEVDMNDQNVAEIVGDIHKAKVRLGLSQKGIVVDFPQGGGTVLTIRKVTAGPAASEPVKPPVVSEKKNMEPKPRPAVKRSQHSYVPPALAKDIVSVLTDTASHVIWLAGPTQCGKSTVARYVGRELGRKVFQINCRGDMGSELFFGEKTVVVDEVSKQNHIVFQKGLVEQAMTEGLDAQGNEVGEPGILFIDEAAAMPAHVAIGINRLLESDDPRRTITLAEDGGRVVRSHSGFRIMLAANTTGRGATGLESAAYTAQMDALDISLLNRVAVCFRFGYDKNVEKHILTEKIGDDRVSKMVLKFRDAIRQHIREGKLTSPFSTAHIVHIADMYRIFGDLGKAIYLAVFEFVLPEERPVYNEQANLVLGKDLMKEYSTPEDIDYMN